MNEGSDVLLRIAAMIVGIVFLRDAYAALHGSRLLITKGFSSHTFEGWQSRVVGVFMLLFAVAAFGVAWYGL